MMSNHSLVVRDSWLTFALNAGCKSFYSGSTYRTFIHVSDHWAVTTYHIDMAYVVNLFGVGDFASEIIAMAITCAVFVQEISVLYAGVIWLSRNMLFITNVFFCQSYTMWSDFRRNFFCLNFDSLTVLDVWFASRDWEHVDLFGTGEHGYWFGDALISQSWHFVVIQSSDEWWFCFWSEESVRFLAVVDGVTVARVRVVHWWKFFLCTDCLSEWTSDSLIILLIW